MLLFYLYLTTHQKKTFKKYIWFKTYFPFYDSLLSTFDITSINKSLSNYSKPYNIVNFLYKSCDI